MYDDHIVKQIKKQVRGFEEKSRNKIIDAQIISMRKLDELTLKKIEEFLKKRYKVKEIVLENKIDKRIKGGIVIKVDDETIDGSISKQLEKLKTELFL